MRTIDSVLDGKNNFDAMRLLAALGVIWSHAYPATQGSSKNEFLYVLSGGQATFGELCVAVFFVISGFLITRSFLRSRTIVGYFANRVLRIVPGLVAVTLMVCLVLGPIVTVASSRDYWSDYLTVRYLGNALIYPAAQVLPGVFATNPYPSITNASIWTLSYEFTCYILIAGICLAIRRAWLWSLGLLAIGVATVFFTYISPWIFATFFSYFLAGSLAYAGRKWIRLDFRMFVLSMVMLCLAVWRHQGLVVAFCLFGTYATIYLAYAYPLDRYNIARYGDFSYGVYLFAWPVQQIFTAYTSSPLANFIISAPITFILAVFSWKLIEKPSLSKKREVAGYLGGRVDAFKCRLARFFDV